jgi:dolichyl-phosphate-mannose--protein O-mannosyl transferase
MSFSSYFAHYSCFPDVTYTNLRTDDDEFVTCGSAVKLSHYESKAQTKEEHFLNSESKNMGSGSGQQIVTSVANPTTSNALWWVRGPNDIDGRSDEIPACKSGEPAEKIPCGSVLRLTHLTTMKNLHSHDQKSPLSRQQEVSAYGTGDGLGDNGDDWKLICSTAYWKREAMVQFLHVDSQKYLGASSTVKVSLTASRDFFSLLYPSHEI